MKIQARVGPSRIAGQGLFATQDIRKGSRIMQYIGEKISSRERARRLAAGNAYIFHLTYRYAIDGQTLDNTWLGKEMIWFCRNFYLRRFEVSSSSLSNRAS